MQDGYKREGRYDKTIKEEELFESLEIFHRGYETVAAEFGLTEENCPDRGRASLPYHKLLRI